jgi:ADP-dependent NAD(P)H-hydrate dehydratase / NAD(P)H-hydrate epimerase
MKALSAAEMTEVDRRTVEAGIPGLVLMENAGNRVVDVMQERFRPLAQERVLVVCGKGNNGGDGFVVARQLWTRRLCRQVEVAHLYPADEFSGDAKANFEMLRATGCPMQEGLPAADFPATLIVDAILGTGLSGPAARVARDAIVQINSGYQLARRIAVDIPSGLSSDECVAHGEFVRVECTVTFTAPKLSQCLSPSWEWMGELYVAPIGSPESACEENPALTVRLTTPADIAHLFARRPRNANKGLFGHVLVIAGSATKPGAAAMAGIAAYRSGAGLVTVASARSAIGAIASFAPELMTEPLTETASGHIAAVSSDEIGKLMDRKSVVAMGPGLGTETETQELVRRLYHETDLPMVVDADALNALSRGLPAVGHFRVLTPHPGEMSRLTGLATEHIQQQRLGTARAFAERHGVAVVLKGDRTVTSFAAGTAGCDAMHTWINPTGCPAMATGGTGDILTGIIAGMIAQHAGEIEHAVAGAAWLHGRAGELASRKYGEQAMLATDLIEFLPEAMNELRAAL